MGGELHTQQGQKMLHCSPHPHHPMVSAHSARHSSHRACVFPQSQEGKSGVGPSPLKIHSASWSQNSNLQNPLSSRPLPLQLERAHARLGLCPGLGSTKDSRKGNHPRPS